MSKDRSEMTDLLVENIQDRIKLLSSDIFRMGCDGFVHLRMTKRGRDLLREIFDQVSTGAMVKAKCDFENWLAEMGGRERKPIHDDKLDAECSALHGVNG